MGYKVAVLMGGQSFEREFSLASGKNVCEILERAGHEVIPLDTTEDLVETLRAEKPDVAYVALHGRHGEDGTIQSLLDLLDIPYVGCTAPVCRTTRNKSNIEHVVGGRRALMGRDPLDGPASWPEEVCIAIDAFKQMGAAGALDLMVARFGRFPLVVKPACGGSALGLHKVKAPDELAPAILDALSYDGEVIVGEWVDGVEVGVSIVANADGSLDVLPPVEVCTSHEYFDTTDRLDSDAVSFYAPPRAESLASYSKSVAEVEETIKAAAAEVFTAFGCRDMARVDLIWDGERAKVIEVDVSPGMSSHSLLPAACDAAGINLGELLTTLLKNAIER